MTRNHNYIAAIACLILLMAYACEKPQREAKVETGQASEITTTTASVTGDIIDLGEGITDHGHCWSMNPTPTVDDSKTQLGSANKTSVYTSKLTNLEAGMKYYIRAYCQTGADVVYGKDQNFTTPDGIATLTISVATNITANSATSGGNITDAGGSTVTARGVCWNTAGSPALGDNDGFTSDGTGTGSYTSQMSGLQANTEYYVRAYATTECGTGYGNEVSILTKGLPELTTSVVSSITGTTAVCGGTVTEDWGFSVTVRGVCWNTSGEPTLESNEGHTTDGSGTGSFTSSMTGLTGVTKYYVRSYAINSIGTSYGEEQIFQAILPVTDYDGNVYQIIQIGNQIWMGENLKVTKYSDGTAIPLVEGTSSWDALSYTDKAYCYYDNSTAKRDTYGALYTWAVAMNGAASSDANPSGVQGVCPTGWHLPGDAEWKELEMYLGMSQADADNIGYRGTDEGGKLKETGTTCWNSPNTGVTNSSGFTALPGGYRGSSGSFYGMGSTATFWSSTEYSSHTACGRELHYDRSGVGRTNYGKYVGFSVRCLRD